eukprot:gnl/MRDRNA2_/MRDRNA2_93819_c0_seq1.p1 gnl/MRDRNA2_/MRDRNA2_93819_c0~~gnl/MRDRNA2_/MRDRNA2_93819_c0_seq1.p1  ORF type:complete len:499 (-),score=105.34 gnl/MRDRNA2_/MRDRNA2_93819_c0_seq1:423-1835(-)
MEVESRERNNSEGVDENHDVHLRGVHLCLDNLVINGTSVLESTLSELFCSIDDIRVDISKLKENTSVRIDRLSASQDSMGMALGEVLESCEVYGVSAAVGSGVVGGAGGGKSPEVLHGKQAVAACVRKRKDETYEMHAAVNHMRELVQNAVEQAQAAASVLPRVDQFELVARGTREDLRRLLDAQSDFSSFFGNEGAFTAGNLREELALHRQNTADLSVQIEELGAAIRLQRTDVDLCRKIEELRRLEASFTATVQEQKAWTARRLQELSVKIDEHPTVVKQCSQAEIEKNNVNRIEGKVRDLLRADLKSLETKVHGFEQLLADISLPTKSCQELQPPPPSEVGHGEGTETSHVSISDLKASNIDEYAYCVGNAKSGLDEMVWHDSENSAGADDASPKSPPLQKAPSMDVRIRVHSKRGPDKPWEACSGLPKWFQEHRSAVLSSKGSDLKSGGPPGRRRPQSARARPFSH